MKAFLLAAGHGSRLEALGRECAKCLVPIGGKPLLALWLEHFRRHGIESVAVNTHHLAHQVEGFAREWHERPEIELFHEPELLGTAGTVLFRRSFFDGEEAFFVIYGDNLTDVDLTAMLAFHRARRSSFTMALFRTPEPEQCGIAVLDQEGRITAFEEKPTAPVSNLANGGIYLIDPQILVDFPFRPGLDFGFDVLPHLVGRMYGWEVDGFLCDIGTPDRLRRAEAQWLRRAQSPQK
ncbi:MAG: nucleotidyltransferase family protein [Deltaproteobacteria bacterium]|nr:nucleotidyltransferase family protein [Deltaproteobacteria bacterium]